MSTHLRKQKFILPYELDNLQHLKNLGYCIGKKIGEGTYSKVCAATLTLEGRQKTIACKIVNKRIAGSEFIKRFLPREMRILTTISHSYIISVCRIFEMNEVIYIFMDYCRNGDLLEYIRSNGPLSETTAKLWFRQLVSAVEYLHNRNLAHRDLKCENVLLTHKNSIKLGDFGFSRSCIDEVTGKNILSETFCGSAAYAAPEILQGIPYDPKMYDMWAMGCILFIMLSASMPFDDGNIRKMLKAQLSRNPCSDGLRARKIHSPVLINLLGRLLEPTVDKRASIKEVSNCEWFKELVVKKTKRTVSSVSESISKSLKRK